MMKGQVANRQGVPDFDRQAAEPVSLKVTRHPSARKAADFQAPDGSLDADFPNRGCTDPNRVLRSGNEFLRISPKAAAGC
jgi:hypothetical protein